MAQDGYFFKIAAEVHPIFRVPSKSIVLQCLIAIVMVMSGTFDQILTYMGFCLGIFPILTVIGVFKLRAGGANGFRMPAYPLVPLVFASVSTLILVLAYLERPVESSIALVTVALGVPAYFAFGRSRHGRFQAPTMPHAGETPPTERHDSNIGDNGERP
jgi:APA family basic amino acid/polyamine antiporter